MPLRHQNTISFLATTNAPVSKLFFEKTVGLTLVEESEFALVFSTGNGQLRIQKVHEFSPQSYTSMGWQVTEIETVVAALTNNGVQFDQHAGLEQGVSGVWNSPSGAKIAWFKDPDGNKLSLTQQ